jgi:hypothetical protein
MRRLIRRLVLWAFGLNETQAEYLMMRPWSDDRYREPRFDHETAPYDPTGKQYWRRERLRDGQ